MMMLRDIHLCTGLRKLYTDNTSIKKDRCLQEIENSKRTFHNEHYETMCKEMLPNFHACRTKRDFKETVWLACNGRPGIGARGRKEDD